MAVLMRLVFLLYAEDRGLIPSRDDAARARFYDQGYGVRALHLRLLEDEALHPETHGRAPRCLGTASSPCSGWCTAGEQAGWMRGRGGKLFDPAAFPFLQGQGRPD